ncbi:MAG: TonB-dependent receptor [Pseudomonadota bacterium]
MQVIARVPGADAFELPASLDAVRLDGDGARAGVQVSAHLGGVAGVQARDRQNHAQDLQLSIRGFGARSTFGVRGVRLLADGIPATMPDGQGQLSHFALDGAERIEVLRGPFSALYGNSSGGVVQLFSADGRDPTEARLSAVAGSHGMAQLSARWLGRSGAWSQAISAMHFRTDGHRAHSAARRGLVNGKFGWDGASGARVDVVLNAVDIPKAQDPLGLSADQLREDPRQAPAQALAFNTRKSVRQGQAGVTWRQPFADGHALQAMAYAGSRDVVQFLAVPVASQANPLNGGGVIDLASAYAGLDLRWTWQGTLAGRTVDAAVGTNVDRLRQHRRGFENFRGTALGVRGALRRDERNQVGNVDRYAQAWWRIAPRWSLLAGVRHSRVSFESRDGYVIGTNPDDSGRVAHGRSTPVAGLGFEVREGLRLHVASGRGFETPTFNELAYRADGGAGLALELRPATSRNLELGAKWRGPRGARIDAALFRADTDDELAVASNVAGRSTFRNVGRSRRQGAELSARLPLRTDWEAQLAWTWLDARFLGGFGAVPAGARIPGIPHQQAYLRLQWQPGPWTLAAEGVGTGNVLADDRGLARAAGHGLLHLEVSRRWATLGGGLQGFMRLDNALDRAHVGSLIVNEANGRYFEPGIGRSLQLGVRWSWVAAE